MKIASIIHRRWVACLVLALTGWSSTAHAAPINPDTAVKDGIEYYLETDKAIYDLGERVNALF